MRRFQQILLFVIALHAGHALASSAEAPPPGDHELPPGEDKEHAIPEAAPPAFTFFVRGIEPDFIDVVLKAQLAEAAWEKEMAAKAAAASAVKAGDKGKPGEKPVSAKDQPAGKKVEEFGGPQGLEPTRYGDWERNGIVSDF